jgi:hypothetical protein
MVDVSQESSPPKPRGRVLVPFCIKPFPFPPSGNYAGIESLDRSTELLAQS